MSAALRQPPAGRGTARVMCWNVDSVVYSPSYAWGAKAAHAVALVREHGCSVLVLQEVSAGQLRALRAAFRAALPSWRVVAAATGEPVPADEAAGGERGARGVQELHAFAFDTARATLVEAPRAFVQGSALAFRRPPVLAELLLRGDGDEPALRVVLCSVHLRAEDAEARAEAAAFGELVWPALQAEYGQRLRSLIVLGDFNLAPPVLRAGARLEPDCRGAFARLRHAGWRHTNEAATNLARVAGEAKVFDNAWCSPQMAALLVPDGAALSTVIPIDEVEFLRWRAEQQHTAPAGAATRQQTEAFHAALWAERCRAKDGARAVAAPVPELPKVRMPTKWFSHGRGWSDHRPLYITLRVDADAAAAMSPALTIPERSPAASSDLAAQSAAIRRLGDELAAVTLADEDAMPPAVRRLADRICELTLAAAQATRRLADAAEAAAAEAVEAAAEREAAVVRRCSAFVEGDSGERCGSCIRVKELPADSGDFWCTKRAHRAQGQAAAAAAAEIEAALELALAGVVEPAVPAEEAVPGNGDQTDTDT